MLPNRDWLVGFNAAEFFFLPGDKPNKELKEVRKLFEAMKPFYEANTNLDSPYVIRLMNERDTNGRVYGSFKLQGLLDTSPTLMLTLFMRNTALALGKLVGTPGATYARSILSPTRTSHGDAPSTSGPCKCGNLRQLLKPWPTPPLRPEAQLRSLPMIRKPFSTYAGRLISFRER